MFTEMVILWFSTISDFHPSIKLDAAWGREGDPLFQINATLSLLLLGGFALMKMPPYRYGSPPETSLSRDIYCD